MKLLQLNNHCILSVTAILKTVPCKIIGHMLSSVILQKQQAFLTQRAKT